MVQSLLLKSAGNPKGLSVTGKMLLRFAAVLILIFSFMLIRFPGVAGGYLYCVFREIVRFNIMIKTGNWKSISNEHVVVRYKPGEEENARLVLDITDYFWLSLAEKYNYHPRGKIPVILYSSREDLNASFGWPASEKAIGVYWGGVIRVLSPDEWIDYDNFQEKKAIFENCGPMAHEITHLVLDYRSNGNYPRWFTEGLAQYEEYRLTGFRFAGSAGDPDRQLYPLARMDKNFDSLPDQSLAYRQSLSAVEYIIKVCGEEVLHKIINDLSRGRSINQAFVNSLGVDLAEFEENWHCWLAQTKTT